MFQWLDGCRTAFFFCVRASSCLHQHATRPALTRCLIGLGSSFIFFHAACLSSRSKWLFFFPPRIQAFKCNTWQMDTALISGQLEVWIHLKGICQWKVFHYYSFFLFFFFFNLASYLLHSHHCNVSPKNRLASLSLSWGSQSAANWGSVAPSAITSC